MKARAIAEETSVLDDAHLAAAEEMILAAGLAGKTPGQVGKIAARAVVTVDPDGARRRREEAEREDARVRFWRERAGTSALAAYGLPTDAALQANANVNQRADEYKKAGLEGRMDQLRVLAFLGRISCSSSWVANSGRIVPQLGEAKERIWKPGHEPDVVCFQGPELFEYVAVNRRAALDERVHHHLEGGRGLGYPGHVIPVDGYRGRRCGRGPGYLPGTSGGGQQRRYRGACSGRPQSPENRRAGPGC